MNMSHGARAFAAAALRRRPSGSSSARNSQPAISATTALSSCEPPSATSTSLIRPAVAPDTSAARVGTSACSELWVGMMTLSMTCAVTVCALWHFPLK